MYGLEFILPRLRPVHVEIYLLMSWYMWFPHYLILLSDRSSSWIHCCIYVFMPEPSVCLSSGKNPRFCVKHFTLRISFHGIASWQTIALSLLQDLESCFLFSFFFSKMELELFWLRDIWKHFRILWFTDWVKNIVSGGGWAGTMGRGQKQGH